MFSAGRWVGAATMTALVACRNGGGGGGGSTDGTEGTESTDTLTGATTTAETDAVDTSTSGMQGDTGSSSSSGGDDAPVNCSDIEAEISAAATGVHLEALAQIAAANGGTRSIGTPGFDASADYVTAELEAAGYVVQPMAFDINVFEILGPSSLSWQGQPNLGDGTDFQVAYYSAPGSVTAAVTAVDLQLGLGNGSTSGCDAADFAGFPAGRIALVQRGSCSNSQKITNAQSAGAAGVLVFNQGNTADRTGLWGTNLGVQTTVTVPVLLTTYAVGEALAQTVGDVAVTMEAAVDLEMRPTRNILAETASGDPNDVIMLGAHLDSVPAGPGINDNGSGSATILELARVVRACETTRKLRFAWWSAEEVGLVGSQLYVDGLDAMARASISLYMNFDMVGSPNYTRFRYDGDGSAFGTIGPMGSSALEQVFADFFIGRGLDSTEITLDLPTDQRPFVAAGIAAGGLFTGASDIKSDAEVDSNGGRAGVPYDVCYHAQCDDLANIDFEVLDVVGDAVAHVIQLYALP